MRAPLSRQSSESHSSSLSDSNYDMITYGEVSEDEGTRTESLVSVDGEISDDISIITSNGGSDEDDDNYGDEQDYIQRSDKINPSQHFVKLEQGEEDSGTTELAMRDNLAFLEFQLDPIEGPAAYGETNLVHVIQSVEEVNTSRELSLYQSEHVGLSLHMSVTKDSPKRRPLSRVLVVSYHQHLAHDVVAHIKLALESTQADDGVELQRDLIVDQCIAVSREQHTFVLQMEQLDHVVSVTGGRLVTSTGDYPRPDLAVFLHPSLADVPSHSVASVEDHFALARHAIQSCQVPILDLSEYVPLFQAAPLSYTHSRKCMYLRVTVLNQKAWTSQVVDLLPVDMGTFLEIAPTILNRHLACITYRSSPSALSTKGRGWGGLRSIMSDAGFGLPATARTMHTTLAVKLKAVRDYWALLPFKTYMVFSIMFMILFSHGCYQYFTETAASVHSFNEIAPSTHSISEVSKPVLPSSTSSSSSDGFSSLSIEPETRTETGIAKTTEKSLGRYLSEMATQTRPLKPRLWINVVGDNHIIVTPVDFTRKELKGKVDVSVSRKGKLLGTTVTKIASGAPMIKIDREEAYGLLVICITWSRHTHVDVIDLGSAWLKASTWGRAATNVRKAMSKDFVAAQTNARAVSARMSNEMEKMGKAVSVISKKTSIVRWTALPDLCFPFRNISTKVIQSVELKRVIHSIQDKASNSYQDAVDTIRAVKSVKHTGSLPAAAARPVQAVARGRKNAKDLWMAIGQHTANLRNGCLEEYKQDKGRCGLACAKNRAAICQTRRGRMDKKRTTRGSILSKRTTGVKDEKPTTGLRLWSAPSTPCKGKSKSKRKGSKGR